MKILVTGANGFVGRALCQALAQRGHEVVGAVRHAADGSSGLAPVGEIGPETDWERALAGVEAVIHLAARVHVMRETSADPLDAFRRVNLHGTERLARAAAAAGAKRLVYVSSVKVNGEKTAGTSFSAADLPRPQDAYAISKWEAECALHRVAAATGLEVVIVRPPLVYGPGVGGNFLRLLRLLEKGVPLPLAAVHNRRSMIFLGNLVDALIVGATRAAAAGQTYLVSDGEGVSTPQLLASLAGAMGRPARLFPVSPALLRLAAGLVGRSADIGRLLDSLTVDDAKIRHELGWAPPYSMTQGLQETVAWYMSSCRRRSASLR